MTGKALEMRLAIKRLQQKHRATALDQITLALTDPTEHDLVVEGWAATCHIDNTRMKFAPRCFGNLPTLARSMPPLHLRHEESHTVGTVDDLDYDNNGELMVQATVKDSLAKRMPAFSVGAMVLSWEMRDADTPDFHAVVRTARLEEISLTDRPANPNAKVMFTYPASSAVKFLELLGEKVQRLVQITQLLKEARP